jgi:hypothetical protein
MKLSNYFKLQGEEVSLILDYDDVDNYDKVFISKVFIKTTIPCEQEDKTLKKEDTISEFYKDNLFLKNDKIEYGGTGFYYDKATKLEHDIEHIMPDYHLYDEWIEQCIKNGAKEKEFTYYKDYSIGFTTRGCFRQCQFCVNKNYKKCEEHSNIKEFMDINRHKLCFLDDNFFACPQWKEIIEQIKATGKKFQFKQGLDERLLTEEKCIEMNTWKYEGDFIFAFDNIDDYELIEEKLKMFNSHRKTKGQNVKFYVFCGFDRDGVYDENFWKTDIEDIFKRIFLLAKYNCKPYIMRHENYENSPYRGMYINLASWGNQPSLFFNHSLNEFCIKDNDRKLNKTNKSATLRYLEFFKKDNLEIFEKYCNQTPKQIYKENY